MERFLSKLILEQLCLHTTPAAAVRFFPELSEVCPYVPICFCGVFACVCCFAHRVSVSCAPVYVMCSASVASLKPDVINLCWWKVGFPRCLGLSKRIGNREGAVVFWWPWWTLMIVMLFNCFMLMPALFQVQTGVQITSFWLIPTVVNSHHDNKAPCVWRLSSLKGTIGNIWTNLGWNDPCHTLYLYATDRTHTHVAQRH